MNTHKSEHSARAHLPEAVRDPGLIKGRCRDCNTVIYSTTTATSCHDAGRWMLCTRPEVSHLDRAEIVAAERDKIRRSRRFGEQ